jgi:hypothetical protein
MDGRAFLRSARHLLASPSEENWRSTVGRAYYALLHEGRATLERWGFPLPPREDVHRFVRDHFNYPADPDLKQIGKAVDWLGRLRNDVDYRLASPGRFANGSQATQAVRDAEDAIALLDTIDSDAARRTAAVAAVRAAFP